MPTRRPSPRPSVATKPMPMMRATVEREGPNPLSGSWPNSVVKRANAIRCTATPAAANANAITAPRPRPPLRSERNHRISDPT